MKPSAKARSRIYASLITAEELSRLESGFEAGSLEPEISLLRVLIERSAGSGEASIETLSLAMSRLAQLLRVQHVLSGDASRGLDDALGRVLREIGAEIST